MNAIPLNKIDTSGFVLKTKYGTDKSELENETPDTSDLVKKTDYKTKINEKEGKIPDISNLATKTALTSVESQLNKLKTFFFNYFNGKSHFEEDGTQNYLVFQPIYRHFKEFSITQYLEYVSEWKSKGLSNESFKAISTTDNSLNLTLNYYGIKIRVKFTRYCLEQQKLHIIMEK